MAVNRLTRVNALMKREIGTALFRVLNPDEVDLSAVTVLEVSVSRDLRNARIQVSIRGDEAERARVLHILRRKRPDIQGLISKQVILKYTPHLYFACDNSIEKGDHVLGILANMPEVDEPEPALPDDPAAPGEVPD